MLVILQKDELIRLRESGLRRVGRGDIRLIIIDDFPFETVIVDLRRFPVKFTIQLCKTRNTVLALIELALRAESELIGICLKLRNICDPVLVAHPLAYEETLTVIGLRIVQPGNTKLLVIGFFHRLVDFLLIGQRLHAQDRDKPGPRILRIEIYFSARNAGVDNRARNIHLSLDSEAGILKGKCVDLGDDLILREILRSDHDRFLLGFGCSRSRTSAAGKSHCHNSSKCHSQHPSHIFFHNNLPYS